MKPNLFHLALGMATYGCVKGYMHSVTIHPQCPACRANAFAIAAHANDSGYVAHSTILGPLTEEITYRWALQPYVGIEKASLAFGLGHAIPNGGVTKNMLRVWEAGLVGGAAYGTAFNQAGLLGSTLVHGAHNLGVLVGSVLGLRGL